MAGAADVKAPAPQGSALDVQLVSAREGPRLKFWGLGNDYGYDI